jgi:hypothetical protein
MKLFCKHCGIKLDLDDVEMNVIYWGTFRMCCQNECWEYEDNQYEAEKKENSK